jgi:hypothetical protein
MDGLTGFLLFFAGFATLLILEILGLFTLVGGAVDTITPAML